MKAQRQALELVAVHAVGAAVSVLPSVLVKAAGSALGMTFYALDRSHRRVALANLSQCFPARSDAERKTIARRMFRHFGILLLELLRFGRLSPEVMRARVVVDGEARVRAAYAKGKGVLFFTGHFGFWEMHAMVHPLVFQPIGVLARPLDNPGLHTLLEEMRQRTGNTVIYREGAVRKVLRTLGMGHGVALLIDQHMHSPDAIWVRFFQRPAATTSTLAALALRTGAPVIPVFAVPMADGRLRLVYEPPVEPPGPGTPDPVREFTQRCTDVLEMYVRRQPELWLWMHRRWRDAPAPETGGMFPEVRDEGVDG
ncbi:MAG: lysophospholipid acyltransferase family protein [Acidobacteria bacterium]|nr:lysophospholipid acyltransferase family protein [Acidobacteriota bacterium]